MKKYRVKENEDLGSIARKYALPSWKYLYELNKDAIGDNPDLLKPGTELKIPMWDSTTGDEKLKEKEIDPYAVTGGLRYRYPWVPVSYSVTDSNGQPIADFSEPHNCTVRSRKTGEVIFKKDINGSDDVECLVPGGIDSVHLGIKGLPLEINGQPHYHPDDDPAHGDRAQKDAGKDSRS